MSWPYTIGRAALARPLLPVIFTFARRSETVPGLLDSGADRSICSTTVARDAGVDVDTLPVRRMRGVGGVARGRLCPMDIELFGRRIATEVLIGETELILLGRDVFDAFVFGFDQRAGLVLIEPY